MKRKLTLAFALLLLSGCASTTFRDGKIQSRHVKFSILNVITYEKTTEGLEIGEALLVKDEI